MFELATAITAPEINVLPLFVLFTGLVEGDKIAPPLSRNIAVIHSLTAAGLDFAPLQMSGVDHRLIPAITPAVPPGAVPVAVRRSAYYGELAETPTGQVMQPTRLATAAGGKAHG